MADGSAVLGRLDDQWLSRDFPVLVLVARLLDEGFGGPLMSENLDEAAAQRGVTGDDLVRALVALAPTYLVTELQDYLGGYRPEIIVRGLTPSGRRAVGLWPREDQGDALVAALLRAAEAAGTPEETGNLRKAAELLTGVGSEVLGQVTGAVVTGLLGR